MYLIIFLQYGETVEYKCVEGYRIAAPGSEHETTVNVTCRGILGWDKRAECERENTQAISSKHNYTFNAIENS